MTDKKLKSVLGRSNLAKNGAGFEAARALREIEEDFLIGPSTRAELDRSHQEALRGEGVSLEEITGRRHLITYTPALSFLSPIAHPCYTSLYDQEVSYDQKGD